jgi:hypothetical protein
LGHNSGVGDKKSGTTRTASVLEAKNMSTPLFRPHGAAQVELSDAILTVHMRGDWNAEMRNQTAQQMRQYAPGLNAAGPWAILNHLHDTLVFSETLFASARQDYAARSPESRLRAVAFVIGPNVEGASLLKPRYESLLQGIIESRVFSEHDSARQWLLQQLSAD